MKAKLALRDDAYRLQHGERRPSLPEAHRIAFQFPWVDLDSMHVIFPYPPPSGGPVHFRTRRPK